MKFFLSIVLTGFTLTAAVVAQQQPSQSVKDRILVLKNGSVRHGNITKTRGGYLIETNGRQDAIPIGYVSFTAENMEQAYRFKRATMTEFTAKTHTEIAEWCLKNQLIDDARAELRQALKIDEKYVAARTLAVELERFAKKESTAGNVKWTKEFKREAPNDESDVIPIGGLTRELATEFVKHVQPILINSCGNGSCHGGQRKQGFHLVRIPSRGSFRNRVELNLENIIKNLKDETLQMKMAMEKSDQVHQRHRVKGLTKKQMGTVANWATEVLAYRKNHPIIKQPDPIQLTSGVQQELKITTNTPSDRSATDIVSRVAAEEKPDPFDPNEFNRLHRRPVGQ